jgi:phage terminase large subunit-like protein
VDIAALLLVFPPTDDDDRWHVHGWYYSPENRVLEMADGNSALYRQFHSNGLLTLTDGDVIDFEAIKEDLRGIASRFDLQQVGFDPWQATQFASEMMDEGLQMIEVRQTVQNMSTPMKEVEAMVLQGILAHGDCPVLSWMASNVVAKLDVKENIYPNKERAENKIDGIVALIIAMSRAITGVETVGFGIEVL